MTRLVRNLAQFRSKSDISGGWWEQLQNRDARFGSKVGQIDPKLDKSRAFPDLISVNFAEPKCTEICSEKDQDLSHLW